MKRLKSFRDLDVKGRTVLLRSDLNSDIVKGRVLKGERIQLVRFAVSSLTLSVRELKFPFSSPLAFSRAAPGLAVQC
jgi:hypothetical protein